MSLVWRPGDLFWLALFAGCVALALFVRVAVWLERATRKGAPA